MANENKAGALILSQLGMFNESVVFFENTVQPSILEGIDKVVEDFSEENGWVGSFDLAGDLDCWLAPSEWGLPDTEDEIDPKAWFAVDTINDDDDYWIARFCGQGVAGGEIGFHFYVKHKDFGGKNAWKAYAKRIDSALISKLVALGFKNIGEGVFFLPVHLDANLLASTWEDSGKFSDDDEVFDPVREVLEKLQQAKGIFSEIMSKAPSRGTV